MKTDWKLAGLAPILALALLIPTCAAKAPNTVLVHEVFDARPDGTHAPMDQFANLKKYPDPSFHVTAPSTDTLFSLAWLNLSKAPHILSTPNTLHRYSLSQRNRLKFNPDGSVDLYLQADNPGPGKVDNRLPAPRGKFLLTLRLYWPKEYPPSILDGAWKPPAVRKVA
jgi:hypothetical protein